MIRIKNKAFTLVELLVTISIIVLITSAWFLNYSYGQNKSNLKLSSKDIAQSLYNARNMAINWLDSSSWNVSVWVFFDNSEWENSKFLLYSYPYNLDIANTDLLSTNEKKLIKEIALYKWIQINNIENKNKFMFFYDAITWSWKYFYWDSQNSPKQSFSWDKVDINISFWWTDSESLSKKLTYIIWTHIVDY